MLAALGFAVFSALSQDASASSTAEGRHCRVVCHFEGDAHASAALELAERSWNEVVELLGAGTTSARPELHLYLEIADYERAEAALTKGRFRRNLAFSSSDALASHICVQPQGTRAVLDAFGLPAQTEHLIAHEAAHLAVYATLPNHRDHPLWLAEGLAEWVAVRNLTAAKLLGETLDDPDLANQALLVAELSRAGALPVPRAACGPRTCPS
jgi:hypothetical protein